MVAWRNRCADSSMTMPVTVPPINAACELNCHCDHFYFVLVSGNFRPIDQEYLLP